jgi:ribosomal subunit interface protein
MQVTVTGRHINISEAFRQSVEEGLQELVSRHQLNPVDALVTISKQGHTFYVDITSHIGRGVDMRAHGEGTDAYTSFAQALDTLASRLRKYKRRLVDHHKHHDQHTPQEVAPHYILNSTALDQEEEGELGPAIIAEMPKEIPQLSVGDAVMHMDLSAENAMIFRHQTSGRLNIVYRRADGNIGWVDPQV